MKIRLLRKFMSGSIIIILGVGSLALASGCQDKGSEGLAESSGETAERENKETFETHERALVEANLSTSRVPAKWPEGNGSSPPVEQKKDPQVMVVISMVNIDKCLKACIRYADDHEGEWPDDLNMLNEYGVDKRMLVNPRQPHYQAGYVYIKPNTSKRKVIDPGNTVVIYEKHEAWPDAISAGFANGRIKLIRSETEFKNLLAAGSLKKRE